MGAKLALIFVAFVLTFVVGVALGAVLFKEKEIVDLDEEAKNFLLDLARAIDLGGAVLLEFHLQEKFENLYAKTFKKDNQ